MLKRNSKEQELLDKASNYLPGGNLGNLNFDLEHAIVVTKGNGSKVWDASGNPYIDYLMGSGPMILGHAHPSVTEAVLDAVQKGSHFFVTNDIAISLAEKIIEAVPSAEHLRFTTSGTDACFQAMRIARVFRQRDKVLKFEGGFHGTSDYAMMSMAPSDLKEFPYPVPSTAGIPQVIEETMMVAPFNDIETTTSIIERNHEELAGVIVEPLQRIIAPQPGFLEGLREVTTHFQIPLIFDEIVTGFRLGYGGAQEKYGVIPDLTALGKIMAGGYPLAAVCGRAEIMSAFDSKNEGSDAYVNQMGTLNGAPVACAAGLATLEVLRQDDVYEGIKSKGSRLRHGLKTILDNEEIPAQICGDDMIFDVYFSDIPITTYRSTMLSDKVMMSKFNAMLLEEGVLKGWPQKFYPSLAHSDSDITETISAFERVIQRLKT